MWKCNHCGTVFFKSTDFNRHEETGCGRNAVAKQKIGKEKQLTSKFKCTESNNDCTPDIKLQRRQIETNCGEKFNEAVNENSSKRKPKLSRTNITSTLSFIPELSPLHCGPCNKTYSSKQSITRHKAICQYLRDNKTLKSQKKLYTCHPCNKVYKTKQGFIHHQRTPSCPLYRPRKDNKGNIIILPPKLKCEDCGAGYQLLSNLEKHREDGFCQQRQEKLKANLETKETTKSQRMFKCRLCDKVYRRRAFLLRHQSEHQVDQLQSKNTNLTFFSSTAESAKVNNQRDLKLKFPCRWCYALLSSQDLMVTHMNEEHHKVIPTDKLLPMDKETREIDIVRPKTMCCYICLKKFHCVYANYICLEVCEDKIGVSLEGYIHPNQR